MDQDANTNDLKLCTVLILSFLYQFTGLWHDIFDVINEFVIVKDWKVEPPGGAPVPSDPLACAQFLQEILSSLVAKAPPRSAHLDHVQAEFGYLLCNRLPVKFELPQLWVLFDRVKVFSTCESIGYESELSLLFLYFLH